VFALFAAYGPVLNVSIIRDSQSGNSRGFGFVTLSQVEMADQAIKLVNGYNVGGKVLNVQ